MFEALETPRLVLDKARLEINASRFIDRAAEQGVILRPHLKTSKSVDVAKIATAGRMSTVTVSTLKEAEYFAAEGFSDILYAVGVTPNKFPQVRKLIETCDADILLITDSLVVAREAVAFATASHTSLQFLIEVDCGEHRGGVAVDSSDLLEIARILHECPAIRFKGVMTHAGHSYSTDSRDEVRKIAEVERSTVVMASRRLAKQGIPSEIVSVGSTPTFLFAESFEGLTEVRCGVYLFFDLSQCSRNVCQLDEVAVSVLATVIGHNRQGNSIVIDAGALALSKDIGANRFLPDAGYGYVCDPISLHRLGSLSVDAVHQEHGTIPIKEDCWFERLPVGSMVRILPNHVCMTAAGYPAYLVVEDKSLVGEWPRVNGW